MGGCFGGVDESSVYIEALVDVPWGIWTVIGLMVVGRPDGHWVVGTGPWGCRDREVHSEATEAFASFCHMVRI